MRMSTRQNDDKTYKNLVFLFRIIKTCISYETNFFTQTKFVDTRHDQKRRLKNKSLLLQHMDSTDIYYPNDRYPNRPSDMEHVSLYDFVAKYDNVSSSDKIDDTVIDLDGSAGRIKSRKFPAIITHPYYDKINKPELYYCNLLLLFKPWRQRSDVLNPFGSYEESYKNEALTNDTMVEYENKKAAYRDAKKNKQI